MSYFYEILNSICCGNRKSWLCGNHQIKLFLHIAFLVNSMILAICFVVFDLEWRREVVSAKNKCLWQSELIELFISKLFIAKKYE